MTILKITNIPGLDQIKQLTEEFPHYIKLTADIDKQILYGGARLHADMEQILLNEGSFQINIWGGGVDLENKKIDCSAIANIRPGVNSNPEILNPKIRKSFVKIVKRYFPYFNE